MKTTKLYKLLFLLPFFLSLSSLASDSLKVKKTEYYEDGKLVRATFFDTLGRKTKDVFNNYLFQKNEIYLYFYENGNVSQINTINARLIGDSLEFQDKYNIGNERILKYENKKLIESYASEFELIDKNENLKYPAIPFLNFVTKRKNPSSSLKYFYDKNGNIDKMKYAFGMNIKEESNFKYEFDSLNRIVKNTDTDSKGRISQQIFNKFTDSCQISRNLYYKNGVLQLIVLSKIYRNFKNQEIKSEDFENNTLGLKLDSKLYPSRQVQTFYEKDRKVKIVYDFLLDRITKTHELKYEFY